MTGGFSGLADDFRAAAAELDRVVAQARQDLARFQRENQPTPAELEQLQDAALRGELGFDMEELARRVDEGRDNWSAIFSGESPNSVLLRGLLTRVIDENREAARTAIEDDPDFDPFPPPEDL
jgi:hypothetical protein